MAIVQRTLAVMHRFTPIIRRYPKQFILGCKSNCHHYPRLLCSASSSGINLWEEYKVLQQTTDGNVLPLVVIIVLCCRARDFVRVTFWMNGKRGIIMYQRKCLCDTLAYYLQACHLMQFRSLS